MAAYGDWKSIPEEDKEKVLYLYDEQTLEKILYGFVQTRPWAKSSSDIMAPTHVFRHIIENLYAIKSELQRTDRKNDANYSIAGFVSWRAAGEFIAEKVIKLLQLLRGKSRQQIVAFFVRGCNCNLHSGISMEWMDWTDPSRKATLSDKLMYNKLYSTYQTSVEESTITTGGEMADGTLINVDVQLELYIEYLRGTEMGILFVNRDCFRNDQELAKYVVDLMVFFVSWYREKFKRIDCLRSIVHCDLDVGEAMFWNRPEKTELEIMTLKYDDARMKKDETDNKLVEEKKNLKDMKSKVGELETDRSKLKKENQQLKKQRLELENENQQLKDENQQQRGSLSTKDKQNRKLREESRLLKGEKKDLECMLAVEMDTLHIVLRGAFRTKMEKFEGEKNILQAELEKFEQEKNILQIKLENLKREKEKVEQKKNILQTELENLKREKKLQGEEKKLDLSSICEVVKRAVGDLTGVVVERVMSELPIPQFTSELEADNEKLKVEHQKTLNVLHQRSYELSES